MIGQAYPWAMRDRWGALWHKVESEIEDRVVTACGRQMAGKDAAGRELLRSIVGPDDFDDRCKTCL